MTDFIESEPQCFDQLLPDLHIIQELEDNTSETRDDTYEPAKEGENVSDPLVREVEQNLT